MIDMFWTTNFTTFTQFWEIAMWKRLVSWAFVASTTLVAVAQSNYASLRGAVTDPQHLPLPGAEVRITSSGNHLVGLDLVAGKIDGGGHLPQVERNRRRAEMAIHHRGKQVLSGVLLHVVAATAPINVTAHCSSRQ